MPLRFKGPRARICSVNSLQTCWNFVPSEAETHSSRNRSLLDPELLEHPGQKPVAPEGFIVAVLVMAVARMAAGDEHPVGALA